jgi:DNA-binding transcriptional LysR family regulator
MDLRQISYLVAALDHGTFTAAAEAAGVSQPTLSSGLRSLARNLGVELFEPSGRGVAPTDEALELAPAARALLDDAARLQLHAAALAARGELHLDVVVCLPAVSIEGVLDPVARLRRARPDVTVRVREVDEPDTVVDQVRDGRSEVGLTEDVEATPGLVMDTVGVQRLVLVRPQGSRALRVATPADLAAAPLVGGAPGSRERVLVDSYLDRHGLAADYAIEVDQRAARSALVLAGAASAVMPSGAARRLEPLGVQVADLDPPLERKVVAVHPERRLSTQAAAFLAELQVTDDR